MAFYCKQCYNYNSFTETMKEQTQNINLRVFQSVSADPPLVPTSSDPQFPKHTFHYRD